MTIKHSYQFGEFNLSILPGPNKSSNRGISYSTAVTRWTTAILIEAMANSGWFTTIERSNEISWKVLSTARNLT